MHMYSYSYKQTHTVASNPQSTGDTCPRHFYKWLDTGRHRE